MQPTRKPDSQNLTLSFTVEQTPQEVFDAICNVRGWWSEEIDGRTDELGAEFTFHYKDLHHSVHRITAFERNKRVVWLVLSSHINFVKDKTEWDNTEIVFEITRKNDLTELRFTHVGLSPRIECYGECSNAWTFYIEESLKSLVMSGNGQPIQKE